MTHQPPRNQGTPPRADAASRKKPTTASWRASRMSTQATSWTPPRCSEPSTPILTATVVPTTVCRPSPTSPFSYSVRTSTPPSNAREPPANEPVCAAKPKCRKPPPTPPHRPSHLLPTIQPLSHRHILKPHHSRHRPLQPTSHNHYPTTTRQTTPLPHPTLPTLLPPPPRVLRNA